MYLKKFSKNSIMVADPVRPGRSSFTYQWVGDGTSAVSVPDEETGESVEYTASGDGWFDFPEDVGQVMLRIHTMNGKATSSWFTPADCQTQIRAGFMSGEEVEFSAPIPPLPPQPKAKVKPPTKATAPAKKVAPVKAAAPKVPARPKAPTPPARVPGSNPVLGGDGAGPS